MLIDVIVDVDLGVGPHPGLEVPGIEAAACGELALIVEIDYEPGEPGFWGSYPGDAIEGCPEDFTVRRVRPYDQIKLEDEDGNVVLTIGEKADIRGWLSIAQMCAIEDRVIAKQGAYA